MICDKIWKNYKKEWHKKTIQEKLFAKEWFKTTTPRN